MIDRVSIVHFNRILYTVTLSSLWLTNPDDFSIILLRIDASLPNPKVFPIFAFKNLLELYFYFFIYVICITVIDIRRKLVANDLYLNGLSKFSGTYILLSSMPIKSPMTIEMAAALLLTIFFVQVK